MAYRTVVHIDARATEVFDFFKDPANYSRAGADIAFRDVRLTSEGVGTHYTWTTKIAGIPFEGFDVFTEFVPDQLITDTSSSTLEGTWTYRFQADGSGTLLTVENHVRSCWRFPPLAKLLDRLAGQTHEPRFAVIKAHLESGGKSKDVTGSEPLRAADRRHANEALHDDTTPPVENRPS